MNIGRIFFILEYFDCVPLFPLDVFINGEDKQEGKEDPGSPKKMPDIVTIEKIQKNTLAVHLPEIIKNHYKKINWFL